MNRIITQKINLKIKKKSKVDLISIDNDDSELRIQPSQQFAHLATNNKKKKSTIKNLFTFISI